MMATIVRKYGIRSVLFSFLFASIYIFASCGNPHASSVSDQASLVPADTLCFPIDDSTHYESKAMFQFEDEGREYLFFQNQPGKGTPHVQIFDIEKECLHKSIPVYREGPNAIPIAWGGYPLDLKHFLITTDTPYFYMIDDKGNILMRSSALYEEKRKGAILFGDYCTTKFYSYYASPAILRDALLYFPQTQIGYPHTKETWRTSNLFAYIDLRTGEVGKTQFCYPSIFDKEEILRTRSYSNNHSYADTGKEVAVSFGKSDSIYVSPDFQHVRAYLAKSRYLPQLQPEPYDAQQDLLQRLRQEENTPRYHHLLYDKYRKVFYRFAWMPYEYPADRSPMEEDTGREFSIIILNENYEVIGETLFPGNTYAHRLWFIGRDGLYLSLNNQGNPSFDEDRLLFRRMELVYEKK